MNKHRPRDPRSAAGGCVGRRIHEMLALVGHSSAGQAMAIMASSGLTMPQMVTLHILSHAGAHPVCAIADRLHLSRAATSHLVDQLARRGYVARIENPDDRRQKVVSIHPKGTRLVEQLIASRQVDFEQALSRLPAEVRRRFVRVLADVVAHLKAASSSDKPQGGGR